MKALPTSQSQVNAKVNAHVHVYQAEYARRLNRVLDYIDQHLDSSLELEQLAEIAHFSRFHFHRVFAAWMGETLGDYARRRRLETAAWRLSCDLQASILDIALACGFASGEAFARAFKLRFDCTPTQWRAGSHKRRLEQVRAIYEKRLLQDSNLSQVLSNPDQVSQGGICEDGDSYQPLRKYHMEVKIVQLPAVRVAYHRYIGPYGPGVTSFWRSKVAPWMQVHGLQDQLCYGIGHDDPSVTAADKCRYDACVTVPDVFASDTQVNIKTLPGGAYAVAKFNGPVTSVNDAWMELMREYLPASGMQCDDRPCFEQFSANSALDSQTGMFSCSLCIPVNAL
ncbi:AraC family transcriptional regulator [Undibacterium pigrum]|uniref:AraC family transcriptional regulator n=1 Tax=Undibacterium pigrum TaxID=401470 RepID=A0A318JHX8_9BURK|nr:GyrI-like domain-containing protein [Undibacterium pigrum]PXX46822.1 AraC family transcriptional regulator [Undibacterium pigrum]